VLEVLCQPLEEGVISQPLRAHFRLQGTGRAGRTREGCHAIARSKLYRSDRIPSFLPRLKVPRKFSLTRQAGPAPLAPLHQACMKAEPADAAIDKEHADEAGLSPPLLRSSILSVSSGAIPVLREAATPESPLTPFQREGISYCSTLFPRS